MYTEQAIGRAHQERHHNTVLSTLQFKNGAKTTMKVNKNNKFIPTIAALLLAALVLLFAAAPSLLETPNTGSGGPEIAYDPWGSFTGTGDGGTDPEETDPDPIAYDPWGSFTGTDDGEADPEEADPDPIAYDPWGAGDNDDDEDVIPLTGSPWPVYKATGSPWI